MTRISIAAAMAGIRNAVGPGGQLRAKEQLSAVVDAMRQLVGDANIAPGNAEAADPLNSPFTIYVNPITGSDWFVGGAYNWFEEPAGASNAAKRAALLKRIENQRITCGYSKERPFRTLNRAAIEIAIATSKNYLTTPDEANVDSPCIELSPGTHIVYNDPGNSSSAIAISEWPAAGFNPTPEHLISFNPNSGGVIIPRHASLACPLSSTHCIIRPSYVPAAADEAADYSNRGAILKLTSSSSIHGLVFRDKVGANSSHHLLDYAQNASQADLDHFYGRVRSAVGGPNNTGSISSTLAVTRPAEWQTVSLLNGQPSEAWDTVTGGSSPSISHCTIRTEWGMCGVFWDGSRVAGMKTFRGFRLSGDLLQRDISCWEVYRQGSWLPAASYQELIDADSNSVRMKPGRMSRHVTAVNDASGQAASSQITGAGRQFFADSGGQLECSSCSSNGGGCVAVARGYRGSSWALDTSWSLRRIRVARSVADLSGNVRQIPLGVVAAISSSTITLQSPLTAGGDSTVPAVLIASGFSLPAGTLIWIENPSGVDWRATLAANAWDSSDPSRIKISGPALQAGTAAAIDNGQGGASLAIGQKVYLRRLIDARTTAERRVSLTLTNSSSGRVPLRHSILQTRPGLSGGGIVRTLAAGGPEVLAVTTAIEIAAQDVGAVLAAEITIRRACPEEAYQAGVFYRQGQTVKFAGKHFTAMGTFTSSGSMPDPARWQESFVQQASDHNAEDPPSLEAPVLIFDTDTDSSSDVTTTCGINWNTIYTEASVRDQLRSATDYRGVLALLLALGFTSADAHASLLPRPDASRELDPASGDDFPVAPSGGAASSRANWSLEFRQPSIVQLAGHRFSAVGYWNPSRSLPQARRPLTALNEFHAAFTAISGGRVEVAGMNTDGWEISNRGLTDSDTGELLTISEIGAKHSQ